MVPISYYVGLSAILFIMPFGRGGQQCFAKMLVAHGLHSERASARA